jgi:hypothetical protein
VKLTAHIDPVPRSIWWSYTSTPPLRIQGVEFNYIIKYKYNFVAFEEVLTAVVMKSNIFWNITPCSPLKINRSFGGTYHLHLQGRKISFHPS